MGQDIRAGGAFVELLLKDKNFRKKLGAAGKGLVSFGAKVTASVLGPLAGAATAFAIFGDSLDKMRGRTGLTVEMLSALSFGAQQSGQSVEVLEKSLSRMQRSIFDAGRGLSTPLDALAELGLTIEEIQSLAPDEQFITLAEAISKIEDPTKKAGVVMSIFGQAGRQMIPLLDGGRKGIAAFVKEAEELGIVMSEEDATAAAELTDALGRLQEQFKQIVVQIGAAIAGPITEFAGSMKENLRATIDFIKENRTMVVGVIKVAAVVGTLGGVLVTLGISMQAVAVAIGGISAAMAFVIASPILAGLAAVAAAFSVIYFEATRATNGIAGIDAAINKLSRSQTDRDPAELRGLTTRFEQLAAKTKLTTAEQKEARKIIEDLRMEYGDLAAFVDNSTGAIVKSEKTLAQLRAARAGQSVLSLKLQIDLSTLAIEALKAEGAAIDDIAKREEALAALRERLKTTEAIIKDANPLSPTPAATTPAAEGAKQAGEQAGEEFAGAFIDLVRDKIIAGLDFADSLIDGAAERIDDLVRQGLELARDMQTPEAMRREVFASFSAAALEAQGQGASKKDLAAEAVREEGKERKQENNRLIAAIIDGGALRA